MRILKKYAPELTAMLAMLMALAAVAAFTGQWPWQENPYNSYTLQACAWLEGRLDLGRDYPWLELAIYQDAYYVSFPPFPSYVLLPFAALCGTATPDGWIALCCTMLGVFFAVRLYREQVGEKHLYFWVMFLFLGTGYPFIAVNGYVWFIAQNMCFTLSLMALYFAAKNHGGLSLGCWACAVGCRPMVLLFFPVLACLLWRSRREKKLTSLLKKRWYWVLPPAIIGGSYMLLNYLRFDSVLEFGHNYLPEFTRTTTGQFNWSYLEGNIANLLRLPELQDSRLSFYSADGNAFWLVIPLFLPLFAGWVIALIRRRGPLLLRIFLPLLAIGYVLILCLHRTLGGWQWGDRYLLDILPWCWMGLLCWMPEKPVFHRLSALPAAWGVAITLIGTVACYNYWL